MSFFLYPFIMLFTCITLAGCMIGPNFYSPASPKVKRYTETPLPTKTVQIPAAGKSGKAQHFIQGQNISAEWWYLFHSKEINALVTAGIANSPNLAAAYAALRVAQETLSAQIGQSLFPAFDAAFSGQRQRFSTASAFADVTRPGIFNVFNATVNVSYTLDVFGGARRQIEALRAQVDYQQFELIAAYLTLASNIVTTAVTIASLEAQIEATRELLSAQQGQLNIIQKQFNLGGVSKENILTQQVLVEQTNATLPPLERNLSITQHALAVLVGTFPDHQLPRVKLASLTLPTHLPVSLPSRLVRQRPDVRASEALLHAASAQVGVATANLFPQFIINNSYYGWQSNVLSSLINPVNRLWSIAGIVTQPVFHGGALTAKRREAIAAYEQACAQYRQVVLQAFQNVADTLKALEIDARGLLAQKRAEQAAYKNLKLTQSQYKLGGVSILYLLNAQQQYQTSRISRIQAETLRYNDTAALFQALGGGWWNKAWCVNECV